MRLPEPATLFADRATRFRALAEDHTLAPYLRFLANLVDGQASAVRSLPPPPPQDLRQPADPAATLDFLLDHVDLSAAPDEARAAAAAVRDLAPAERASLAANITAGAYPLDRVGESLFLAAALQVHLARLAAQLDVEAVEQTDEGTCPVCGGAPVSSLIVGWTNASKARYCACSLCGTLWNYVRIKCTACAATDGISYYTIEDGSKTIGIEACTVCRSYIKHMQQHEDTGIDPLADDVASYALDLLAREEAFNRAGINPLFLTG